MAMSKEKAKHCIVCKCELPSSYRIPLCRYHRDSGVDKAKWIGGGVAGAVAGAFVLVRTGSIEKAKDVLQEHLSK